MINRGNKKAAALMGSRICAAITAEAKPKPPPNPPLERPTKNDDMLRIKYNSKFWLFIFNWAVKF